MRFNPRSVVSRVSLRLTRFCLEVVLCVINCGQELVRGSRGECFGWLGFTQCRFLLFQIERLAKASAPGP